MKSKFLFGDITANLLSADTLTMVGFTPAELNSPDSGRHRADTLIESCNAIGKLAHSIVVLMYDYDNDTREIYEIPEVVSHIEYLFSKCPHFLYFVVSDLTPMRPLLLTLYKVKRIGVRGGNVQLAVPDIDSARRRSAEIQSAVQSYSESIGDRLGWRDTVATIKSLGV